MPDPTDPIPRGRRAAQLLDHNLFVALVVLVLTGGGTWYTINRSERREAREARISLSQEIEPWVTSYLLAIRDSANLGVTYGTPDDVRAALGAVRRLRSQHATLFSTRGAQLAGLFGPDALDAYIGMSSGTLGLEHCLEIMLFRMTAYPAEASESDEREQLRAACSNALRELNDRRSALLLVISSRLAADSDTPRQALQPMPFGWVRAEIRVNGSKGVVSLEDRTGFTYTWSSPDATGCQLRSPTGISGITRIGMDGPILTGHPWYPAPGTVTVLSLTCTNGWAVGADSLVLRG